MPPRIPVSQGLKSLTLCLRPAAAPPAAALRPLIQTANLSSKEKKRLMKREPYKWAQIQARLATKKKRQDEIKKERDAAWGSPVHGLPTPFVESFDSAGQAPLSMPQTDEEGKPLGERRELPTSPHILDHHLSRAELEEAIATSYQLSKPIAKTNSTLVDPVAEAEELEEYERGHQKAIQAIKRMVSLDNASSKGRTHANVRRCVETFGRHNTDQTLRPKPLARGVESREPEVRAGPDTGSSEVQIAILTAKIRVLAKEYEGRKGHKDKFNRRNLRLLCHRRQRLMKYMERREKGSERWTHMIGKLGLSPATWKEQIMI